MTTILTSRQFNQDTNGAKRAAEQGPVFITTRGRPTHVLLTIEDYRRLAGEEGSIVDRIAMPDAEQAPFEPSRAAPRFRGADLS